MTAALGHCRPQDVRPDRSISWVWGLPPTIKLPQRRRLCCCCCRGDSAATNFRERYRTGKLLCKPSHFLDSVRACRRAG